MQTKIKKIVAVVALFVLSGCMAQSAIPLGNDMMEINVSAAPVYGRAGAMKAAFAEAARATLAAGYDKFVVANNDGWNEAGFAAGSYGAANVNAYSGQANRGSFAGSTRHPEAKMLIKMFHAGDKGSEKAIDAREAIKQNDVKEGDRSAYPSKIN